MRSETRDQNKEFKDKRQEENIKDERSKQSAARWEIKYQSLKMTDERSKQQVLRGEIKYQRSNMRPTTGENNEIKTKRSRMRRLDIKDERSQQEL